MPAQRLQADRRPLTAESRLFMTSLPSTDPRLRRWQWRIFGIAWLSYASFYLCRVNIAVALPLIQVDLGWARSAVGAIGSVFLWVYAIGQLVLLGGSLDDLENPNRSLAIANPTTAPYGMAAMEVIARSRFSAGAARKLVRGGNALQAYQFWATGNVDLALVPRSLTLTQGVDIPPDWHQPIAQFGIALTETPAVAEFVQWLTGNNTRQSIAELGYRTCS